MISGQARWDAATAAKYGTDKLVLISEKESESASFVCPECRVESDGCGIKAEVNGLNEQCSVAVKIRKLSEHARIPTYGTAGAACFDLYAAEDAIIAPGETKTVGTGLSVEIPDGYELQIRPRSGISLKTKLRVANSPGCVDSDFRGEVAVIFDNIAVTYNELFPSVATLDGGLEYDGFGQYLFNTYLIRRGDRIAQAAVVPVPRVQFVETDEELTNTVRGNGGFGHTGTN